jgi:hypothetical protein
MFAYIKEYLLCTGPHVSIRVFVHNFINYKTQNILTRIQCCKHDDIDVNQEDVIVRICSFVMVQECTENVGEVTVFLRRLTGRS